MGAHAQTCQIQNITTKVIEDSLKIEYNCEYGLNKKQIHVLMASKNYLKHVRRRYSYFSLKIGQTYFTITIFKFKKNKITHIDESSYLTTPNPLFGKFFSMPNHLILIYTYLPFNDENKQQKIQIIDFLSREVSNKAIEWIYFKSADM